MVKYTIINLIKQNLFSFPVLYIPRTGGRKKYEHKKTPDKIEGSKVGELLFFILKELELFFV